METQPITPERGISDIFTDTKHLTDALTKTMESKGFSRWIVGDMFTVFGRKAFIVSVRFKYGTMTITYWKASHGAYRVRVDASVLKLADLDLDPSKTAEHLDLIDCSNALASVQESVGEELERFIRLYRFFHPEPNGRKFN